MVAKTNAAPDNDEDIIELTDILEQGTSHAPGDSAVPAEDQLRDLTNANTGKDAEKEGEDDLDALLAEIGSDPQASSQNAGDLAEQRSVNPDETLDMPDMRELENLLDELNIPSQPSASTSAAAGQRNASPPAASLAPTAQSDPVNEIDALLDGVAAAPAAPAPPATPTEALDALLDSIAPPSPAAKPTAEKAKSPITISASVSSPISAAKPAAPKIPRTAGPAEKAKSPITTSASVSSPIPAAKPAAPKTPETVAAGLTDDLDALLESMPAASPGANTDKTLSSPPERSATDAAENAPASTAAVPSLPIQWENLLGSADGASPVPPNFMEQLERIEKQIGDSTLSAHALSSALAEAVQRVNALEESVREISTAQSEPAGPDSRDPRNVETLLRGMEERLKQLEARLDKMERDAKEELERAAAAAAARILREELAALLAEETQ